MIFGLSLLYWGLWLAILILWMGRFVTSFLSIYLVSALRLDEGVVGTVVAMYGFGAIIGCLFGGTLSDRFGRQSMIIIGEIGAAAALLVVSVLTDPVSLGAALFVYGAFASLPSPAIAAYIADVVPAERQQRAYVLQSWAINFGYAIGPIVANQLVKISYSLMFYVEAAVMIAVTILLIAFFREVRHLGITVLVPVRCVMKTNAVLPMRNSPALRGRITRMPHRLPVSRAPCLAIGGACSPILHSSASPC